MDFRGRREPPFGNHRPTQFGETCPRVSRLQFYQGPPQCVIGEIGGIPSASNRTSQSNG